MSRKRKVLKFTQNRKLEAVEEVQQQSEEVSSKSRFPGMVSWASELGFSVSLPIVGGAFLGQFLDNKFNTTPRMTLSFIFLGLFVGMTTIFLIVRENSKK